MPDRRRVERFALTVAIAAQDADTGEALGEGADISGHGLMLASQAPLSVGRRYHLRLVSPGNPEGPLELWAEAAWSVRSLNPAGHRTGFRRMTLGPGDRARLDRLIEHGYTPGTDS